MKERRETERRGTVKVERMVNEIENEGGGKQGGEKKVQEGVEQFIWCRPERVG